ncbi:hypothetical protein Lal_00034876 [Lupinus albus]|nr:hypothetical protein Lal_00034876 [Lupinus albus]
MPVVKLTWFPELVTLSANLSGFSPACVLTGLLRVAKSVVETKRVEEARFEARKGVVVWCKKGASASADGAAAGDWAKVVMVE